MRTSRPGAAPRARSRSVSERLVLGAAARIERGELVVRVGGEIHRFGAREPGELSAEVEVRDPRFFPRVLSGGAIGVAEAYRDGWWESPDLVAVVRLLVRNRAALDRLDSGIARLAQPARWLMHRLRRNTLDGSRRNIARHYDLSNDFFRLLLDETMTYSSAIFETPHSTLAEASTAKIDRLCRKLELGPRDRLLEVGTGWGSFAIHAAREYGCRVTTTTISREQHALAKERVREAGLDGRVDLLLADYRELTGRYDKIVSVEMVEAVGHEYYGDYFASLERIAEPDALFALQAITIADDRYERARRTVDFIKRHIFPGSNIPSVTALLGAATARSDWRLRHLEEITPHYCRTLAEWRGNLSSRAAEIEALGLDERFRRLFEYYLAYCEGGFEERAIGCVQMLLSRPEWRGEPPLPGLTGG